MTEPNQDRPDPSRMPEVPDVADSPEDLLAAYALDALDSDDVARVEAHLAANPDAQVQLDRYHDAIAGYAEAELSVTPPADVWQRINERTAPPVVASEPPATTSVAPVVLLRRASASARARWLTAAAAALVIVAGLAFALSRGSDATRADQFAEAVDDADNRTGLVAGEAGTARIAITPDGAGLIDLSALDSVDAGRTYQLWSLDADVPVSLGVLTGAAVEDGIAAFDAPPGTRAVGLSVEPVAGSASPTLPVVATGELT
jgi:anti-sigma-K factor RskA